MSMKIFSDAPYYDDYDETKKYLRVLFRPGVSLQVRELNQLQSYLQSQVERIGTHLFKEGSMVIPGQSAIDMEITYLKIETVTDTININNVLPALIGATIVGQTTGVVARISNTTMEGIDPITLYVRYISAGNTPTVTEFEPGELLVADSTTTVDGLSHTLQIKNTAGVIGFSSVASIERGIYFVKGQFALVEQQQVILDKYSNTPSYRIGLSIAENIITPSLNNDLNDNANGTPNENAPGAHRYQIVLTLTKLALNATTDNNFIELIRVSDGTIQSKIANTTYAELAKTLARRTYDESGHYTVTPFKVAIREHRNNDRGIWTQTTAYKTDDVVLSGGNYFTALNTATSGPTAPSSTYSASNPYQTLSDGIVQWNYTPTPAFNRGYLTPERLGDDDYMAVAVEPGKAYVQGYEIEKIATEYVKVSKARTYERITSDAIPTTYGNYFYVNNVHGLVDTTTKPKVSLYNKLTPSSSPQTTGSGTLVGYARLRGFEFDSGTPGTTTGTYKAYVYDVEMVTGYTFERDVKQIYYNTGTTATSIVADVTNINITLPGFITVAPNTSINGTHTNAVTTITVVSTTTYPAAGTFLVGTEQISYTSITPTAFVGCTRGANGTTAAVQNSGTVYSLNAQGASGTVFTNTTGTGLKINDYIHVINSASVYERRRIINVNSSSLLTFGDIGFTGTITSAPYDRVETSIVDPNSLPLLFPLAQSFVRKVRGGVNDNEFNTTYTVTQRFDGSTSAGQVSMNISVGSAIGSTTSGTEFNPAATKNNYIIVNKTDGTIDSCTTITLSNNGVDCLIAGLTASKSYSVFAPVRKSASAGQEKTKTLVSNATVDFSSAIASAPLTLSLAKADGYRIVAIKMAAPTVWTASSDPAVTTDITSWYTFDNGQKDTHYGVSSITRKDGYLAPTGAVRVIFDYFDHSLGTAGDYFTVDSYNLPYVKIPYHYSSTGIIALADVMDFRPRLADDGINFTGTGVSLTEIPKIGFETVASYSYYLPRIDKLTLNIDGQFFTVDGVPALSPSQPKTPSIGMLIANLNISAYTLYPAYGSVTSEVIDTKRYTMRDIGKLDKRIENLEYYTALSLLEQETKTLDIRDSLGLDRFKNGFIVDSFKGQDLGDAGSTDYRCAIDMTAQELRPFYTMSNVNLIEENLIDANRSTDHYALTGDIITLPYTSSVLIDQPYASHAENINPFAIFTFLGNMSINPSTDEWFEVDRRPDIVNNVEGNYNAVQTQLEATGVLGTIWGAWETNWVGQTREINRLQVTRGFDSTNYGLGGGRWMDRHTFTQAELEAVGGTDFGQGGVGARVITFQTTATTVGLSRSGVTTSIAAKTDYQVVEDKILQSALIPYIRAREVLFVCKGLKPNAKLYAYFDDTEIKNFITPATKIVISGGDEIHTFDTDTNVGGAAEEFARQVNGKAAASYNRGDVVYVKQRSTTTYNSQDISPGTGIAVLTEKSLESPYGEAVYLLNIKGSFAIGDIIKGSISGIEYSISATPTVNVSGDDIITNFNGSTSGVFNIPNTTSIRFRTGVRDFKLTDSITGSLDYTTQGRAQYRAQGILETKQKTINAIRNAEVSMQPVSGAMTTEVYSDERAVRDTGWYDPLAQTFLIQSQGGSFITKLDLFFATKDVNIPVTVQIREVINGYPGSKILPFSRTVLMPNAINVDITGILNTATTITFDSPVYLQDQTEYCIVLLSDSNNYRVWVAQLGEKNIGTDRFISEQPYAGVLFKSQNASTWTANQEQDLKFKIWSAQFDTTAVPTIVFNNEPLHPVILNSDPFQTTDGSPLVRIFQVNHGMVNNSTVIISNVAVGTYNGIVTTISTGLNGQFNITNVTDDSYTITASSNASATGFVGGSNIISTKNIAYDGANLILQSQVFADTTLSYGMVPMNGSYNTATVETPLIANATAYFPTTNYVASQINENEELSGNKSLVVNARMTSSNRNVSPVIDTARMSLTTIKNKIDTHTVTSKNVAIIDDKTIISVTAGVVFAASTPTIISIPSAGASRSSVRGIAVGKYITISGTSLNNTTDPVLVTAIASDGSTITVSGHAFVTETPASTTIVMKDNFVSDISPIGSSSSAKYVTRVINLDNASTFLKIMFAANVPAVSGSDIQVWYKLLPSGSTTDISTFSFVQATTPVSAIVKTSNPVVFTDVEFDLDGLPAYDALVVKIVFKSGNSAQIPRVKDLRIIACA